MMEGVGNSTIEASNLDFLAIGNGSDLDMEILTTLLTNEGMGIERAPSQRSAVKKTTSNRYNCIIVADDELARSSLFTKVYTSVSDRPIIVLYTETPPRVPDWAVHASNVELLHYTDSEPKQVIDAILEIATSAEYEHYIREHRTLQDAMQRIQRGIQTADTRTELEQTSCAHLGSSDLYTAVWIAQYDEPSNELIPIASSGIPTRYLCSRPSDEIDTDEIRITEDASREQPERSITVPLRSDETLLGTLTMVTTRLVDDVERTLLSEIGESIAAGIQARDESQHQSTGAQEIYVQSLSHELRNHLQTARATLETDADDAPPRELITVLDRIERLDQEAQLLTQESVTDRQVGSHSLEAVVREVQSRMPQLDHRVHVLDSPSIEANRYLLELFFENLFRNVKEHTDSTTQIRVGETDDGFFLEDTGPGLPDKPRDLLFAWEDGDEYSGTGLAIVNRIVELHGWDIVVTQSHEGGARFEIGGITRPRDRQRSI